MDGINKDLETLRLTGEEDFDIEYQEEEQPLAQELERVDSHQSHIALTKKNQEMKLIIEQLRDQLDPIQEQAQQAQEQHQRIIQDERNTSICLRYQRDQYRSTARDLANRIAQIQQV